MRNLLVTRWVSVATAVLSLAALGGCSSAEKTRNDSYFPASQQCVTDTDPSCVGAGEAGVSIPLPEARAKNEAVDEHTMFGHCEMVVEGDSESKPCQGIKLVLRSSRENEVRTVLVDGYNFKVEDLNSDSYKLEASSPIYDVETDTKEFLRRNNRSVKIHVHVRPLR